MSLLWAAGALIAAFLLIELIVSTRNERRLRARGAIEPADDVWRIMSIAYPAAFIAMVVESRVRGGPSAGWFAAGLGIWTLAKLLKGWAVVTLGDRWSFRVLVLPGEPLVTRGPYKWMRHPNYVAVAGELIGAAVMLAAPYMGVVFTALFVEIMRRRVQVEERALGLRGM
ncbi:MAG TPA: isoprenylcysteine carboxylmethyltransferase family protein [Vicinamibacterales bacterium]|nr:isoprenylcysteine carboxylmethyltransferase family protein [Vicinamibacterales bacterium]